MGTHLRFDSCIAASTLRTAMQVLQVSSTHSPGNKALLQVEVSRWLHAICAVHFTFQ
jgi:hypothetical protein